MGSTAALVTDPVQIFFIVLVIILLAPLLLNRLRIPHIIGMIVAGVCVGPYGFHVLDNDASFSIFGQVGLLYLMFLAGIEIDLFHLRLNLKRGMVFGLLTFFIPLVLGIVSSMYLLHLDAVTSTLLASMYASHTLIAYPVTARFGITKAPAVLIAIVGTIVAVIGALIALALSINIHDNNGEINPLSILSLVGRLAGFCAAVAVIYPWLTRHFFRRYTDRVTQFVYVLALVFLASFVAKAIGLEAVLGAFLSGLVLNRFVPDTSPLMSRIEFVGNALFIPYFLIGVGMMIDIHVIGNRDTLLMAADMLVVALAAKWVAAFVTQKLYGMTRDDRQVMFGLTTAHTAVALAVVTIGYNFGLMDRTMLNGTVLMILITCALAPMVTSGAARRIKIRQLQQGDAADGTDSAGLMTSTMVAVSNPLTAQGLMELGLMIHPAGLGDTLTAVHVRNDNSAAARTTGRTAIDLALGAAAMVDVKAESVERFDLNTATGLLNVISERDINCVVMGFHRRATVIDSFYGAKFEQIIQGTNRMVMAMRFYNPLNTLRRIVVWVPPKAEYETGFRSWVGAVGRMARSMGCRLIFLCSMAQRRLLSGVLRHERLDVRWEFRDMEQWDDFVLLANRILDDDLLVVITARPGSMSHSADVQQMPTFLQHYFQRSNLLIIYPEQFGKDADVMSFADPIGADQPLAPSPLLHVFMWPAAALRRRRRKRHPRIPRRF